MKPTPLKPRLDALTSLRGVAAATVFLLHFTARVHGAPTGPLSVIASQGRIGVVFFFCLSGFILTWSHRDGDAAVGFWRRRFARIYPAYLVTLLIGAAVTIASHGRVPANSPHRYGEASELVLPGVLQVFLLQSWVPVDRWYLSLNGVGWSLCCEAFFYALFPFLIPALARVGARGRRLVQAGALSLIVVFATVAQVAPGQVTTWLQLHAPFTTVLQFILGITVALDVLDGRLRWLRLGPALAVAAVIYLLCGILSTPFAAVAIPVLPILALIAAAAIREAEGPIPVLSWRPMIWLGEISYTFYLVHQSVIRCFGIFGGASTWLAVAWQFSLALGLAIVAAWLLHRFVERPFERRLRGGSRSVVLAPRPGSVAPGL